MGPPESALFGTVRNGLVWDRAFGIRESIRNKVLRHCYSLVTGFVHKKEPVWSEKDRADVGYRTRDELKDIVNMHENGLITDPNKAIFMAQIDNSSLEAKVEVMTESIKTLHKRMPKQSYNYNAKDKQHEEIIRYHNRVEINKQKANQSWG